MKQWAINLLLFILVCLALLFAILKITPFEITGDTYIGTIVSLLSLAVAFVIGYQIYNAIELKREIKEQREKYNDIIKRNEDTERTLKQHEYVMQEGFDVISSLIRYNSKQSFNVANEAFLFMHQALVSSIETDRTDYGWIFSYLRLYISEMNGQAFALGYLNQKGTWYVNTAGENEGKKIQEVIDEYTKPIKDNDQIIRNNKNFCKIQFEYERIMSLFYRRLADIVQNPLKDISPEENDKILNYE